MASEAASERPKEKEKKEKKSKKSKKADVEEEEKNALEENGNVDQDDGKITQAVDALLRDLIIPSKK